MEVLQTTAALFYKKSNRIVFVLNLKFAFIYISTCSKPRTVPPGRNERKGAVISFLLLIVRNKLYLIFK